MPAMPEPRPKVNASISGVRMPITAAMRRFCVTARIERPSPPQRNVAIRAPSTSAANRMIQSRFTVSVRPPSATEPLIHAGELTSWLVGPKMLRTACCRIRLSPQVASKRF